MERAGTIIRRGSVCAVLILGLSACATTQGGGGGESVGASAAASTVMSDVVPADPSGPASEEANGAIGRGSPVSDTPPTLLSGSVSEEMPPAAKPGECYARVTWPAVIETVEEQVVATPASETVRVIPATFKTVTERIVLSEPSERKEAVPATYKTVAEDIVVAEAVERIVSVPAVYETVTEQVKVAEATTVWKRGVDPIAYGGTPGATGPDGRLLALETSETGEILCLVEIPAQFKTVTRRVLKTPPTTKTVMTPAKTRTVTRRVIDQPATTRSVAVPGRFATVTRQVVDTPERVERVPVPETYRTVKKRVVKEPARSAWAPVLCQTNATPDVIRSLQTALKQQNLYRGPIDGVYGAGTKAGLRAYQRRQGQPRGPLTLESLSALGVTL